MPARLKESATASKSGRVAFAAEVAEKSGAALSVSKTGLVASTCACATPTLPSSNNAHRHTLFMIRLSRGLPHVSSATPLTVNNTGAFVYVLSHTGNKVSGDEGANGRGASSGRSCSANLRAEGRRRRGQQYPRSPRLREACLRECTALRRRVPRSPCRQWQTLGRLPGYRSPARCGADAKARARPFLEKRARA